MRNIVTQSILTPIKFTIVVAGAIATLWLYQATGYKWALGLPIYLLPILWWISYRRLKGDFDPLDWNNPFRSRKGTLLFQTLHQTFFGVGLTGIMLVLTTPSFDFRVILFPFAIFFVITVFSVLKLERKREVLSDKFQLNVKAIRICKTIGFLGWLIVMTGMLALNDNIAVIGLGFLIFGSATIVLVGLLNNPKDLK